MISRRGPIKPGVRCNLTNIAGSFRDEYLIETRLCRRFHNQSHRAEVYTQIIEPVTKNEPEGVDDMLQFMKITLAAMTALTVTSLAACSSIDTAGSTITISASIESSGQASVSDQDILYGSVTAIDGDNIAIAVGTWNDAAAGASGSAGLLTLTGETLTLTVTGTTTYSIDALGSENTPSSVSFSDIATDSILKVTYDTETSEAVSIVILGGSESISDSTSETPA